jgi:hypothetical protein
MINHKEIPSPPAPPSIRIIKEGCYKKPLTDTMTDKERYLSICLKIGNAKKRARYKMYSTLDLIAAIIFICSLPILFVVCLIESFIPWSYELIKDLWFLYVYKLRN